MGLLRVLLAFAVVIAHCRSIYGFVGIGGSAVQAFFIISGFYMALILDRKYVGHGALKLFYSNRFLRLFPLYWFILLIYAVVATFPSLGWTYSDNIISAARNAVAVATGSKGPTLIAAIPNLFLLGADALRLFLVNLQTNELLAWHRGMLEGPVLKGAYSWLVIPPIWSLSVEIIFYVFAPFIIRKSHRTLGLLFVVAVLTQFMLLAAWPNQGWLNLTVPYNGGYFVLGIIAYRLMPWAQGISRQPLFTLASVPFLFVFGWQLIPFQALTELAARLLEWGLWLIFALCIPPLFELTKKWGLDQKMGNYSYPIYLSHSLFTNALTPIGELAALVAMVASWGMAQIGIWLIDKPIEGWRRRRVQRSLQTSAN